MFLDINSIIVNGIRMGQYITEAKYGYHKLWGKDTGRNLAGDNSGSLLGIYPKITLQFRKLKKDEIEELVPTLDSAVQYVTYYDPNKRTNITIDTYTNDYEIINKQKIGNDRKCEQFSIAFISNKKRV